MGFFDFLFDEEKAQAKEISGLEDTLTNMYVQPPDREHAISRLCDIGTQEAIEALLSRFEEQAPNTTVDIDEKQTVYEHLVDLGEQTDAPVFEAVKSYLVEKNEKINWPLKALDDLTTDDQMRKIIIELLADCPTGYQRNPEKKQELIIRAADYQHPELADALFRFLEDENETIRFLTVKALLEQEVEDKLEEHFIEYLPNETSLRILQKLAQTFADHKDWKIPDEAREEIDAALPDGYAVHDHGHIYET
jgi:HEAT repeat protein